MVITWDEQQQDVLNLLASSTSLAPGAVVRLGNSLATIQFLRDRIDALLRAPDMWTWGPPAAVELQLLQLLEVAHVAAGSSPEVSSCVARRYWGHVGAEVQGQGSTLAECLGLTHDANDRFKDVLRRFVDEEWKRMSVGHSPG